MPASWYHLVANAIWILGCALALATVSVAHWEAQMRGERLRVILSWPRRQVILHLAGLSFSLGMAVTSPSLVQFGIWLILVVVFAVQARAAWLAARRGLKPVADPASADRR